MTRPSAKEALWSARPSAKKALWSTSHQPKKAPPDGEAIVDRSESRLRGALLCRDAVAAALSAAALGAIACADWQLAAWQEGHGSR